MRLERLRILVLQPATQPITCLTPHSSDLGSTLLLPRANTRICDTNQWHVERLSPPRLRAHFQGSSCSRQSLQMRLWSRSRKCGPSGSMLETSRWSSTRIQSRGYRPRRHPLRADDIDIRWAYDTEPVQIGKAAVSLHQALGTRGPGARPTG